MGFDITMHDSIGMTVIKRLEQFKDVIADIIVGEGRVQHFEVGIVDVFKDEGWRFGLWITYNV